jgi:hypothetical protein
MSRPTQIEDPRMRELIFLDQLEKKGCVSVGPLRDDCPERLLCVHLLVEGHVNDASHFRFSGSKLMVGLTGKEVNLYAAEVEEWGPVRLVSLLLARWGAEQSSNRIEQSDRVPGRRLRSAVTAQSSASPGHRFSSQVRHRSR